MALRIIRGIAVRSCQTLARFNAFRAEPFAIALHCSYNAFMSTLRFEWDNRKAAANAKKHGVGFEEARTVFVDDRAKLIDDPDHSEDEGRFVLLGLSSALRLLLVCHCYRAEGNVIRIISARKASAKESKSYP